MTAGLMLLQWPLFVFAEAMGEHRLEALSRTWTDARIFWRGDADWALPAVVTIFAPLLLVPGAFGVKWRQIVPRLQPTHRWYLVLGLIATIALTHGINAAMTDRDVGVATNSEALWLRNGDVASRATWLNAATVEASCEMVQHRRQSDPQPVLRYEVHFPDGRVAPLSDRADADVAAWTDSLAPIDATLRAARIPREGTRDPACLEHYFERLGGATPGAYWSIMGD
ncbi:MAG TPA: hypothetical protein VN157_03415 [Caulobacter sp.]|nr:hypothetical protein [Caulobacter sp.]